MERDKPLKVAIIGGGCAGMTAAFELSRPEHAGRYQVTVYQQGWRLGGKGASGRGPADRIEEHGLHLWMGFYENAFRLMRECYGELGRDPKTCRIADWQDAFKPDNYCGVMERSPKGEWIPWTSHFPAMPGLPGDPDARASWTVGDYLTRSASLVVTLLQAIRVRFDDPAAHAGGQWVPNSTPADASQSIARFLRFGELASITGILQAVELLNLVVNNLPSYPRDLILRFHEQIASAARAQLHARTYSDPEARRLWEIVDLTLAIIRGVLRFGLISDPRGFDAIDDFDCREWLRMNGASETSVNSAFVRALYDLAFAYESGDVTKPRIAAGQALRGAVRAFFTYRGAFFWKMQAGMGDVVFAPLYEVLAKRGVRFRFFHKLRDIRVVPAKQLAPGETPHVCALQFDVQAKTQHGRDYRPLVDVRNLPCWPAEPLWEQLVGGKQMRARGIQFESHWDDHKVEELTLKVTRDFDFAVLAVGLGAVPYVGKELLERSDSWQRMVDHCKTVSTQALQLWMNAEMTDLGWRDEPINISGFVEPFDTWADMRQLIPEESFKEPVRSIAYFCSVLPDPPPGTNTEDPEYRSRRYDEVERSAAKFLNEDIFHIWPGARNDDGRFRWNILCDARATSAKTSKRHDERALTTQFWTANVNPTDGYSLSLPGTLQHRISPLDDSFDNLTVAGDWTDCGFNEGCVEAAIMSGRLAAHAISQLPALEDITGYHHP